MKQGTFNYQEYSCNCKGRINRRFVAQYYKGLFRRPVYEYRYECSNCGQFSETYIIDWKKVCEIKEGGVVTS